MKVRHVEPIDHTKFWRGYFFNTVEDAVAIAKELGVYISVEYIPDKPASITFDGCQSVDNYDPYWIVVEYDGGEIVTWELLTQTGYELNWRDNGEV